MEIWDIYNRNREKTGRTIERGKTLTEDEFHLVVHIWIMSSQGKYLIQKRAPGVQSSPNMWATTGGAAIAGDDSFKACAREMFEEIGVTADMTNAKVAFTVTRNNSICDVWIIHQDINLENCKLQVEEVSEVKWASAEEIKELVNMGEFHNYSYLDDLFHSSVI